MSGIIEGTYGTATAIAVTAAATLASAGLASSAAVNNSVTLWLDALVEVDVTVGTVVAPSIVNVFAAASIDGGTVYGGGEANMGTDHTVTLTVPPNIVLLGIINCPTSTTAYKRVFASLAAAFGGIMPDHWCIVIENKTGAALTAAAAKYQGQAAQYT